MSYILKTLTGAGVTGSTVIIEDEPPPQGFIYLYRIVSARNVNTATSDLELGIWDGSKFSALFRANNLAADEITLISDDEFPVKQHENLRVQWFNTVDADVLSVNIIAKLVRPEIRLQN